MVTFADARRWNPQPLFSAANDLSRFTDAMLGHDDDLTGAAPPSTWTGGAAVAAGRRYAGLRDHIEHVVATVAAVRRAVGEAAGSVAALQRLITETDNYAHAKGFRIGDNGTVSPIPGGTITELLEQAATSAALQNRVKLILSRAKEIDTFLTATLRKALHGEINDGKARSLGEAATAGDKQGGGLHDHLLKKYRVSVDPHGMVEFPPTAVAQSIWKKLGQEPIVLTASEARLLSRKRLVDAKDAFDIRNEAQDQARQPFNSAGWKDGHSDAYRHAYWNALLTQRFGEPWAEKLTIAHERNPNSNATAVAMDLHNNEVGRRIATEHPEATKAELGRLIERAVHEGELVVVGQDGQLVRSNEVNIGATGNALDARGTGPDPQFPYEQSDHEWHGYNPGDDGNRQGTYGH